MGIFLRPNDVIVGDKISTSLLAPKAHALAHLDGRGLDVVHRRRDPAVDGLPLPKATVSRRLDVSPELDGVAPA